LLRLETGINIDGEIKIVRDALWVTYERELDNGVRFILVTFTPITCRVLFPVILAFCNVFAMFSVVVVLLLWKISVVFATTLPLEKEITFASMNPATLE
jgi:hypothetical protein